MVRKAGWRVLLVLSGAFFLPNASHAGPFGLFNFVPPDCPPGDYSPLHYCAPTLWKMHARCHGVKGEPVSLYADESCFQVEPRYLYRPFHCPSAPPDGLSDYGRALPMLHRVVVEDVAGQDK